MEEKSKQFVRQIREGNREAFGQLLDLHQQHVAATIRGMLGNCPEVEDVGQETFIRAYRKMDQFKGNASFKTWITRIAINLSLNELNKRKRQRSRFQLTDDTAKFESRFQTNESKETQDLVQQGINQLDSKFRSVLVLRLIQGYSTKETAETLEIPQGTVLSRLNTAQKKLKEVLIQMNPELG